MKYTKVENPKTGRVDLANEIIRIISQHGRRFFSLSAERREPLPESEDRISRFELDARGRIWFIDKWSQRKIYTAYRYRWRHFSEGGTLRELVNSLRDYIRTGEGLGVLSLRLGPFPEWLCGGDPWGYGADMGTMRAKVIEAITAAGKGVRAS